ncbi:MAG: hypothetical protein ACTSWM_00175 [Alphaproteobacteria bacterium]
MGLLDEITPEQAEIKKLENAIAQMQLGIQRTDLMMQGGPDGFGGDFPKPDDAELASLQAMQANLQQQMQQNQGLLADAQPPVDDTQFLKPGNDPLPMPQQQQQQQQIPQIPPELQAISSDQSPEQQQITELTNQIQMLQGMDPSGQGGVYGMLGYKERGGGAGGQGFQPTMPPDQMNEIYGLLAELSDDPTAVGMQYVKSMQGNDQLRASNKEARYKMTDAMRPQPHGSPYPDAKGNMVQQIWDPNLNGGRGGSYIVNLGRRFPKTIDVGGVEYEMDAQGTWNPSVDPKTAGLNAGVLEEEIDLGKTRALDKKEQAMLASDMALQDEMIRGLIESPNFSESVGPFDTLIKNVGGAAMGGEDSLLNRKVQIMHNQLTTLQVADWKGAISERELDFFHASVPDTTDHHQVWIDWYNDMYTPTMEYAMKRARGEISGLDYTLKDWVDAKKAETTNFSAKEQEAMDRLDKMND